MDRGTDHHPATLDRVPAYPSSVVEEFLADARRAEAHLRGLLTEAEARQARASAALEAADESHRILGQMMVEAQQDLTARRDCAEKAAADLLARAEGKAQRFLTLGRAHVAATLGLPLDPLEAPAAAPIEATTSGSGGSLEDGSTSKQGSDDRIDRDDPPRPPAVHAVIDVRPPPPAVHRAPERSEPSEPAPATNVAQSGLDGQRRRPRWLRTREAGWPDNAASEDESYFTRLRDELRADGSMSSWVETA